MLLSPAWALLLPIPHTHACQSHSSDTLLRDPLSGADCEGEGVSVQRGQSPCWCLVCNTDPHCCMSPHVLHQGTALRPCLGMDTSNTPSCDSHCFLS